jgi:succinoglycan biosynthesis protein ExoA
MFNNHTVGVGGPIETIAETNIGKAIAIAMSSVFGVGGSTFRIVDDRTLYVDTIAFPAYKREVWETAGPFDEEFICNEDDEYNYRIRKQGGKLMLVPEIRSRYYGRESLAQLWKQYYRYGYWKVRVLQKHPLQMCIRQFVPPAFVGSLLISSFLAIPYLLFHSFSPLIQIPFFTTLALYLFANLTFSLWSAARNGWRFLLLFPLVYSILHISYGLGFLVGLIKFLGKWKADNGKAP